MRERVAATQATIKNLPKTSHQPTTLPPADNISALQARFPWWWKRLSKAGLSAALTTVSRLPGLLGTVGWTKPAYDAARAMIAAALLSPSYAESVVTRVSNLHTVFRWHPNERDYQRFVTVAQNIIAFDILLAISTKSTIPTATTTITSQGGG
jgi:hypothetical protein